MKTFETSGLETESVYNKITSKQKFAKVVIILCLHIKFLRIWKFYFVIFAYTLKFL